MKKNWKYPERASLEFKSIQLIPLDADLHSQILFEISKPEANRGVDIFEFMLNTGPFINSEEFRSYLNKMNNDPLRLAYTVFSKRLDQFVGTASIMNINITHGVAELGSIWYCTKAQRTEVNTETIFTFLNYLFDTLQYRRVEWKCNNVNQRSKDAAIRLGFTFEGVFRHHMVDKGKNRDTAWYSIIDSEWADIRDHFEHKLLPGNHN
ncbi:MAG TPA: GNAT family protein [Cyclobacteriaceae bacterium]|jgi:RimJ/RimL family protein N-acetyltransferase